MQNKIAIIKTSVLNAVEKKASPLLKKIDGLTISSKQEFEQVAANVAKLKEYWEEAEKELGLIIGPSEEALRATKESIKNAKALFAPFQNLILQAEKEAKAAMLNWLDSNEAKAKAIEAKFDNGAIKKISTVTAKTSELRDTKSDSASVRKVWTLKIVDAKKIPREFLVPDEQAIKEALKTGAKVAGCTWTQEKQIAIHKICSYTHNAICIRLDGVKNV